MNTKPSKRLLPAAILLVLALELALALPPWLAARRTAPAFTYTESGTAVPAVPLDAGRYLVTVSYLADTGSGRFALTGGAPAAWQDLTLAKSSNGVASGWLTLTAADTLSFAVATDADVLKPVTLLSVQISAAPWLRQQAARRLAGAAALDLLALAVLLCRRRRLSAKTPAVAGILLGAAVLSAWPTLTGGLRHGSDLGYHLRRIENIAAGLSAGQFPVRIEPDWINSYGYAVGVFYGDAFLYFPALLRLAGFTVTQAYFGYLALVHLATAGIAYGSFKRMLGQRLPALTGAVLYTLASYRLCDLYTRAALGEYTALAFLPLVACGFWLIYRPGAASARRLPGWLLLALGMSGILQSHLLTLELTAGTLILLALACARRTFTRPVLARLFGAVGVFLALNAGFLVPFLDFYLTGRFAINQPGGTEPIQQNGALPAQLFGLPADAAAQGLQQDLVPNMALTPGWALWGAAFLCAGLLLWLALRRGRACAAAQTLSAPAPGVSAAPGARPARPRRAPLPAPAVLALWVLPLGCLTAFAATALFPWDALYALGGPVRTLVGSLQFPWRSLSLTVLLFSIAAAAALCLLRRSWARRGAALALCAAAAFSALAFARSFNADAAPVQFYYGTEEANWQMSCGHYLPMENGAVQFNDLPAGPQWGDGVTIRSYRKAEGGLTVDCANTSNAESPVRLTLLYYRGYTAVDVATGQRVPVVCGKNDSATLLLPAGYDGTLRVRFQEPWYWRAGELLTLAALAGLLLGWRRRCRAETPAR